MGKGVLTIQRYSEKTLKNNDSKPAKNLDALRDEECERFQEIAGRYGYAFADLSSHQEDVSLWQKLPMELIMRYRFVPLRSEGETLVIAVDQPEKYEALDALERALGTPLSIEVATTSDIERVLSRNADSSFMLDEASEALKLEISEENVAHTEVEEQDALTSPIIRLVDSLLLNAIERRASDIHIETKEGEIYLKYRVDGVLYPAMESIDRGHHSTIVSRLKVMAELDVAEKRIPQDGRFKIAVGERAIDFRVSVMPSIFGEDVVVRVLDKRSLAEQFSELRLDVLGFHEVELKRLRRTIREPYGMILVTGPTGSGKTTTLYAALSEITTPDRKFVTIEDPVEYQIQNITQVPVNEKKGLTFARGLRSILRHDPDTIMVGEVRDADTASIAVQAALTGHLVFTTVHANNVFDVIGRFMHMGVEPYNFISALNAVMAQRLVRKICNDCKKRVSVSAADLDLSGLNSSDSERDFFAGVGCRQCDGSGYRGRTAICELMALTDRLRELILSRGNTAELKAVAREEGMISLREHALDKVFSGITTLEEINKVTFVE